MDEKQLTKLAAELHKPAPKTYPTRKLIPAANDEIWSADLIDMTEWDKDNDGYKWALNVIDIGTRYLWSKPLKAKGAAEVARALEEIITESKRQPKHLWVDEGKEFYNAKVLALLKSIGADRYTSYGKHKAFVIERLNKTMKNQMWLYFTAKNTRRWLDSLPALVSLYNNRTHQSLGITPAEASQINLSILGPITKTAEMKEAAKQPVKKKPTLKVGDIVRISRAKGVFEKGYLPNWSREMFVVSKVQSTAPPTYKITDYHDEEVKGAFYEQELQKVDDSLKDVHLVEAVLKKKPGYSYVKWLGWPASFNQWIPDKDVGEVLVK